MAQQQRHRRHHHRPHRHHYDADMLSVEEARKRILAHFTRLEAVETPLLEARGRTLDEDLVATFEIPPLDNSAMDGYAVRSQDIASASEERPQVLPVAGAVAAGELPDRPVPPGGAIRIMTGAPVPDAADAVIPFEDTDEEHRRNSGASLRSIGIKTPAEPGENIRPAGEDVRRGDVVLKRGVSMRPAEIGVAASIGRSSVRAVRRPEVAIISTGDELLSPGEPHRPGMIYNSNAYSIAAQAERYGGEPRVIGIARDTVESLNEALDKGMDSDMIVTSAGVSKGDYDVVKDVLAQRGEIALWSVRMRPAKPLAFGALKSADGRSVPHLGLPGNPVSAMVAFEQFGRPALRLMLGLPAAAKPSVRAILDDPIHNHDGRRVYARVTVYKDGQGSYRARTTGNQSSGVLTSMAAANGLAICPDETSMVDAGQAVDVEMLDWPESFF